MVPFWRSSGYCHNTCCITYCLAYFVSYKRPSWISIIIWDLLYIIPMFSLRLTIVNIHVHCSSSFSKMLYVHDIRPRDTGKTMKQHTIQRQSSSKKYDLPWVCAMYMYILYVYIHTKCSANIQSNKRSTNHAL